MKKQEIINVVRERGVRYMSDAELEMALPEHLRAIAVEWTKREAIRNEKTVKIRTSRDAFDILHSYYYSSEVEKSYAIFLNRNNKVIGVHAISEGGMTATIIDTRVVFKKCLELGATGMILSHNHPSGNLQPSEQDIELTKRFREVGRIMEIQVLDHIILAGDSYTSLADEGKI
jgi:DNA repair protein RadC